ncbi:hypothetical protein AW27_026345 [Streptomyces sp. PCS3-D2]|uniref:hypothetical protein n=1 Tax=Streptomyces sp. PCS3-D2 TaxID=1460244 RepID=UPI000446ABDD|nr:hypothetical protein [Streptomyces sp. PCS3-D2]WKV74728.1 hypothetical protein AW27_026345 [Streptomyces sp. PCS3-D2]
MALTPLAGIEDLSQRGLAIDPEETALTEVYLGVASAAVREAAGTPISLTTSTVTVEGEPGQWLRLPGLPVTAVATVSIDGVTVTDWRLRSGMLWRSAGWTGCDGPAEVEVTYTHGLAAVPADIIDLVCRMAAAALVSYRAQEDGSGLAAGKVITSERLGDWAVTYAADGRLSEMELSPAWAERLAARFGGGLTVARSR